MDILKDNDLMTTKKKHHKQMFIKNVEKLFD